jgi:membrane-associated protein
MTDILMALVPDYGVWLLGVVTFLSCLAIPVPSSLLMVAGGAFAAGGDLSLMAIGGAAYGGAVAGDQTGFALGRKTTGLLNRIEHGSEQRRLLLAKAHEFSDKWGGIGVFLSRWLLAPLGPYVNFIGGATGLTWATFTFWGALGELVWVTVYTGLGFTFSNQIQAVADIAGNISGFLAAGALALVLGRMALRSGRDATHHK